MNKNLSLPQENELGINIEAGLHPRHTKKIIVRGKFRVACGQHGVPDQGAETLKHIVLVTTRSGNYQALTPFQEVVVFADDVQQDGDVCSAFFNIDVMDHIAFEGEGDYYILCSLGMHTSNIIKVTVN